MEYRHLEKNVIDLLPFIRFFQSKERILFFENMQLMTFEKNQNIIDDNMTCQNLFFVRKGSIRVYRLSEEGNEITMYRIGKGETCLLTLACIIGHSDFEGFAVVEEDVDLITIPSDIFEELFSSNSQFRHYFIQLLLEKMKNLMILTEEIAFHGINKRVAKHLLWNAETSGILKIKTTHEAIAFELGTAREVVSRMLKEFEKKRIVNLSRGSIEIIDEVALKKICLM